MPTNSAPPKYSPVPHPLLKLSRTALPPEASSEDFDRAVANFSCSVTRTVQSNYATAVRHFREAEASLGREFHKPPTDEEMTFFTNFLLGKSIKVDTVKTYLTALT